MKKLNDIKDMFMMLQSLDPFKFLLFLANEMTLIRLPWGDITILPCH